MTLRAKLSCRGVKRPAQKKSARLEPGARRHQRTLVLEKLEHHFDRNSRRGRLAIGAVCRLELPIAHRFNGFLIQAEAGTLHDFNVCCFSVGLDDQAQQHFALILSLACLIGIVGARAINADRRAISACARVEDPATRAAARTGTQTSAVAAADSTAGTRTHPTARTRSIRIGDHLGQGIAPRSAFGLGTFSASGPINVGVTISAGCGLRGIAGGASCALILNFGNMPLLAGIGLCSPPPPPPPAFFAAGGSLAE
jgi:hypothetical protein